MRPNNSFDAPMAVDLKASKFCERSGSLGDMSGIRSKVTMDPNQKQGE